MFTGRILKTFIFAERECWLFQDKQINKTNDSAICQRYNICWDSGHHGEGLCGPVFTGEGLTRTFVFCYGNEARKLEEQSVQNQGACLLVYIETSKTFNLPPFHTTNDYCLAEARSSVGTQILKFGWKTKSGLFYTPVLELGIFYIAVKYTCDIKWVEILCSNHRWW